MKLLGTLFTLSAILYGYANSTNCGTSSDDIIFFKTNSELDAIQNCSVFNGSMFINGEYDLNDFNDLTNLEVITGYLLIWNTPTIRTLKGLRNIREIQGNTLYMDRYAVYILDNRYENSGQGLCYANNVEWENITPDQFLIRNNAEECLPCHSECRGCWAYGPTMCQHCSHMLSGNTCVSSCPEGTILSDDNYTCVESLPGSPYISSSSSYINNIDITWDGPLQPNGVITGYRLYQDNNIIWSEELTYNGLIQSNPLTTNYNVTGLSYATSYNFSVQAQNSMGWGNISTITSLTTLDGIPDTPENISISDIDSNQVDLRWNYPVNSRGTLMYFWYQLEYTSDNQNWVFLSDTTFSPNYNYHTFTGLHPWTNYRFRLLSQNLNHNSSYSDWLYFKTNVGLPPVPETPNVIEDEITSDNIIAVLHRVNETMGPIQVYNFKLYQYNENGWEQNQTNQSNQSNSSEVGQIYHNNLLLIGNLYLNQSQFNSNIMLLSLNEVFNLSSNTGYALQMYVYTSDQLYSASSVSEVYYTLSDTTPLPNPDDNDLNPSKSSDDKDWEYYAIIVAYCIGGLLIFILLIWCVVKSLENNKNSRNRRNRRNRQMMRIVKQSGSVYERTIRNSYHNPLYTGPTSLNNNILTSSTSPTGSLNNIEETEIHTPRNSVNMDDEDEITPVIKFTPKHNVVMRHSTSGSKLRRRSVDSAKRRSKEFQEDLKEALQKKRPQSNNYIEVINHDEVTPSQHKRRRRNNSIENTQLYQDASDLNIVPKNMMLSDL